MRARGYAQLPEITVQALPAAAGLVKRSGKTN